VVVEKYTRGSSWNTPRVTAVVHGARHTTRTTTGAKTLMSGASSYSVADTTGVARPFDVLLLFETHVSAQEGYRFPPTKAVRLHIRRAIGDQYVVIL
jgi:hypothetical protein